MPMQMNKVTVYTVTAVVMPVVALVVHGICLATPYYGEILFDDAFSGSGSYYFGLWEICPSTPGDCIKWGDPTDGDNQTIVQVRLDAARALAILGASFLVFASVVAVVDVVFKSQGDRRRLLPICIISLCAAAAILIFTGDMVFVCTIGDLGEKFKGDKMHDFFVSSVYIGFFLDVYSVFLSALAGLSHNLKRRQVNLEASVSSGVDPRGNAFLMA